MNWPCSVRMFPLPWLMPNDEVMTDGLSINCSRNEQKSYRIFWQNYSVFFCSQSSLKVSSEKEIFSKPSLVVIRDWLRVLGSFEIFFIPPVTLSTGTGQLDIHFFLLFVIFQLRLGLNTTDLSPFFINRHSRATSVNVEVEAHTLVCTRTKERKSEIHVECFFRQILISFRTTLEAIDCKFLIIFLADVAPWWSVWSL